MNDLNVFNIKWLYRWRNPLNWPRNIKIIFRSFKMAYQRVTKGYCDWDIYDLDWYYSRLIGHSLKELGDITISHPYNIKYEDWKKMLGELGDQFLYIGQDPLSLAPSCDAWGEDMDNKELFDRVVKEETDINNHQIVVKNDAFARLCAIYEDLWD